MIITLELTPEHEQALRRAGLSVERTQRLADALVQSILREQLTSVPPSPAGEHAEQTSEGADLQETTSLLDFVGSVDSRQTNVSSAAYQATSSFPSASRDRIAELVRQKQQRQGGGPSETRSSRSPAPRSDDAENTGDAA